MFLTSVALERFKAIEHAAVEVAPLTVLIGGNNAGKSSVLHAVGLLAQSVNRAPWNTQGEWVDLGPNAAELAHRPSDEKSRSWRVVLEWSALRNDPWGGETRDRIVFGASLGANGQPGTDFELHFEAPVGRVVTVKVPEPGLGRRVAVHADEVRTSSHQWPAIDTEADLSGYAYWSVSANIGVRQIDPNGLAQGQPAEVVNYAFTLFQRYFSGEIANALLAFRYVGTDRHISRSAYPLGPGPVPNPKTASELIDTLAYDDELREAVSRSSREVFGYSIDRRNIPDKQVSLVAFAPDSGRHNAVNVGAGLLQIVWILTQLELAVRQGRIRSDLAMTVGVEEPELHLHPGWQPELAKLLVHFVKRGVRLICTTQSEHFLMSVLTLVLEGTLLPTDVLVHFMDRGAAQRMPVDDKGRIQGGLKGFFEANEEQLKRQIDLMRQRA